MKATAFQMAGLALALSAGVAMAQAPYGPGPYGWGPDVGGPGYPGGPRGPAARVWLDVDTQSERGVFLVAIRYAGIAPDELKITPQDDELRIHVERSTQQQGPHGRMFAGSHVSRRVNLPADADVSKMQRQDGPGFVTLVIPRRMVGPRW